MLKQYPIVIKTILLLIGCSLFAGVIAPPLLLAQPINAVEGQSMVSSGYFNIIWGDGAEGATQTIYTLTEDSGQRILLSLDESLSQSMGGVLWLDRKKVNVGGVWGSASVQSVQGVTQGLKVFSISLAPSPQAGASIDEISPAVIGSQPWVTIMCKFSDMAVEPKNLAYFTGMYANVKPGLDHYWRELSYNTFNVEGSNAFGWFVLPNNEVHYEHTNPAGLYHLADDCIAAADPSVNFSLYTGINMMFNFDWYNGWAWGGSISRTLDGVTKNWSITWEPPWAYSDISVIQHEMGHGFGLPHSSGAYGQTYDNDWDVMSKDRYNCAAATDSTYGCIAQGTISYHKDKLGVIPAGQKFSAALGSSTTITLEQLALPATSNYKMAKIPIGGSITHFYTVEARRLTGYDNKLAGAAVIIHEVDTTRQRPAYVIDTDLNGNTADAGAMWVVGETFIDSTNNISVRVDLATATGFQVTIVNGGSSITIPAAVDQPTWAFTNGGNTSWYGQSAVTHDGVDAAENGDITDSQSSSMETTVTTGGQLGFWWKVSSESGWDYLRFYVNDVEQPQAAGISGEVDWVQVTGITVPAGATLKWVYSKDNTVSSGSDAGWVDQVVWTSTTLPTVSITAPDATTTEAGATTGYFTVSRTGSTTSALTVNYTVSGTATSGSDYNSIGTSVTIPAGASSANITATPIDDTLDENDETLVVTLSANAAYTVGSPSSATVTIQDDDAAGITVTPTSGLVTTEAGGTASFTIRLNSQPTANVTIGLSSSDTTEGTVSPTSVMYTSANWSTPQTVTITGVDDSIVDGNVAYTIVTAAATSVDANYNGMNAADVSVTNNDNDALPTVSIIAPDATATEAGATTGYFMVTRTGVTTSALTVNFTASGTATSGSDYNSIGTSVTIPAGALSANITVTPIDDTLYEGTTPETVIVTLSANAAYTVGSPSSATVTVMDDDSSAVVLGKMARNIYPLLPEGWIVNAYTEGSGPYTVNLAVLKASDQQPVPFADIQGMTANPLLIVGDALVPDLTLVMDEIDRTAYILHDSSGQLHLSAITNIRQKLTLPPPVLQATPTLINFGTVTKGTTKNNTVTVTNTGGSPLHFTSITSPSAPFSRISDTCTGAAIPPSGTCSIGIRFAPTAAMSYNSSFSISSDGGNAVITLQGTGSSSGGGGLGPR